MTPHNVLAQGVELTADTPSPVGRMHADVGAVVVLAVGIVVAAQTVALDLIQGVLWTVEVEVHVHA